MTTKGKIDFLVQFYIYQPIVSKVKNKQCKNGRMNENGRQLYILKKSSGHSAGWAKIVLNAVINLFKGMIYKTSIN